MKTTRAVRLILCSLTVAFFAGCGGDAAKWQAENAALRSEVKKMKAERDAKPAPPREAKP